MVMRMTNKVVILNPHDSQGVQIADGNGIYPCIRGCGGGGYQQGYVLQHLKNTDADVNNPKEMFCDLYNGTITGDTAVTLTANTCASANHAGPTLLILNDQGGGVIDTSEDVTMTLRAQEHGHQPIACYTITNHDAISNAFTTETIRADCHGAIPVVCFEPGILSRDCSAGNRAYVNICSTLRAEMGDNRPAVCYRNE